MARALWAASLLASSVALAQGSEGTPPQPGAETPQTPQSSETASETSEVAQLKKELEGARREVREMREEIRAQLATQSIAEGWQDEFIEERRKLELFVPGGYFRVRPELFHRFDLNRLPDVSGYQLFPRSYTGSGERTHAGVNMRLRFEPTLNISEEVRLRAQVDALDNFIFGSTPEYVGQADYYGRYDFGVTSDSQAPGRGALDQVSDTIAVKRVFGEVATPVGVLRFGRMGSQWGLGMVHNDGSGIEQDFGDTVDRLMFVTKSISGFYIAPMLDFYVEGPLSIRQGVTDQPFDLSNSDDAHGFLLAIARRDTDQQIRAKLDANEAVLEYGLHLSYRVQKNDAVGAHNAQSAGTTLEGSYNTNTALPSLVVERNASLFIPDLWVKYERKQLRLELEVASVFGSISNRALRPEDAEVVERSQGLNFLQFGAVLQGEYRFLEGDLRLKVELGYASGDAAPGLGNYPARRGGSPTRPGDIDGPQYACVDADCTDASIRNFRFDRAYRIDMILWREILGGLTDALYAKPTLDYRVAEGLNLFVSAIYSRTVFEESAPAHVDPNLGIELNGGVKYETEDGFYASVNYGVLFPLGGLGYPPEGTPGTPSAEARSGLEAAQAVRGLLGVRF